MIPVHFQREISARHVKPVAYVALQFLAACDFCHCARGLTAPYFELKQPVARNVIPLSEKQVVCVSSRKCETCPICREEFRQAVGGRQRNDRKRGLQTV